MESHHQPKLKKQVYGKVLLFGRAGKKKTSVHLDPHEIVVNKNDNKGSVRKFQHHSDADIGNKESKEFDSGDKKEIDNKETDALEQPDEKLSLFKRILKQWADDDSILRLSWTTPLLIVFTLITAGIFYAVEKDSTCNWNYAKSLWFVNTIYTTIGYGTLKPCTGNGRVAAVILALIGIPINVVALVDLGKLFVRLLSFVWSHTFDKCIRLAKRRFSRQKSRDIVDNDDEESKLPLTFALSITLLWILLTALYFDLSETDRMSYGDALYFTMISVTTIGFGDETTTQYDAVAAQFFFIYIGIALFSMVINIVQDRVDSMADLVENKIGEEYAKSQTEGDALKNGGDQRAARQHVNDLIKHQQGGGLLKFVMGKQIENRLVENYMDKSRMRVMGTQTDNIVCDRAVSAVVANNAVAVQAVTSMSAYGHDKGTQLKWMPKVWKYQ